MWVFFAILAPALYAVANILDNFLSNKKFKDLIALVFYSFTFNIIFIPFLFLFQPLQIPPLSLIPIFLLLGLINVGYLYPYYRGLQSEDTSIAMAFFGLGRIFIPILAFFIVGEVLAFSQYIGILCIIIGITFLSLRHVKKELKLSKALWYIATAAFITAFEGVFMKYLFEHGVNVSTALGGELAASTLLSLLLLFHKNTRSKVAAALPVFLKTMPLFAAEESFTFLAFASETYALSYAPVSIVKSLSMFTPFFLMLFAWMFGKRLPKLFKEEINLQAVLKKTFCFVFIVVGIILLRV